MGGRRGNGTIGLNVLASPILFAAQRQIIEQTARLGIPAIYQWPEAAEEADWPGMAPASSRFSGTS